MCIFFVNFERGGTEEEDTAATFEKADARRRRRKPKKGENKVRARAKRKTVFVFFLLQLTSPVC